MSNEELAKRYYDRWEALAERHGLVVSDKERFLHLIRAPVFVEENNPLFLDGIRRFSEFINFPSSLNEDTCPIVEKYLEAFETFVEKWKTRPVSIWLFLDDHKVIRRSLEMLWDWRGKTETIKRYPWTTERDLRDELSRIRRKNPDKKRLSPFDTKLLAEGLRMEALKNAGWNYDDIISYLTQDAPLAQRIRKLVKSGKSPAQAEEIAERDLPEREGPECEAVRKKVDAAEKTLTWFKRESFEEGGRGKKKRH